MAQAKKQFSFMQFALVFLVVYLGTQFAMRAFFPAEQGTETPEQGAVRIEAQDSTIKEGHHPILVVHNETGEPLSLPERCPQPPLRVWRIQNPGASNEERVPLTAEDTTVPCQYPDVVPANAQVTIDLAPWKYSLFGELGLYQVELMSETQAGTGSVAGDGSGITTQFEMYEAGFITQTFRTFVTKPLLNVLIFIASLLPDHNLGIAIIILTVLVKLLLFLPTQHAMEGQRKLQAIQPKIEELRRKYKEDPQKLNQETLKLWKREKINPMQSCLPMLLQFPVLIGLFFVIRDGSHLELSQHLIYTTYQDLPWTFGTNFLGLNLLNPHALITVPVLVVLQFVQMKLSFAISERKKGKQQVVDVTPKKDKKQDKEPMSPQEMQQKVMLYGLPLMIGFFAIQFPSAVSLYWAVSTLFAIGQQLVVNRKHL